jgi:hypothetical protein
LNKAITFILGFIVSSSAFAQKEINCSSIGRDKGLYEFTGVLDSKILKGTSTRTILAASHGSKTALFKITATPIDSDSSLQNSFYFDQKIDMVRPYDYVSWEDITFTFDYTVYNAGHGRLIETGRGHDLIDGYNYKIVYDCNVD